MCTHVKAACKANKLGFGRRVERKKPFKTRKKLYLKASVLTLPTVTVSIQKELLTFKGPLGSLSLALKRLDPSGCVFLKLVPTVDRFSSLRGQVEHPSKGEKGLALQANQSSQTLSIWVLTSKRHRLKSRARINTLKALFVQSQKGVSQGWLVSLECVGVGFRASLSEIVHNETSQPCETRLELKVGQSHPTFYKLPLDVRIFILKPTLFYIFGVDKQKVNQVAAEIRAFRPPEPYKGKGIRYRDELILFKQGKKK